MKWNSFLQDHNNHEKNYSPFTRVNRNHNTSKESGKEFHLKSCQKNNNSISSIDHKKITDRVSAISSHNNHIQSKITRQVSNNTSDLHLLKTPESSFIRVDGQLETKQLKDIELAISAFREEVRMCFRRHFEGQIYAQHRKEYQIQFGKKCAKIIKDILEEYMHTDICEINILNLKNQPSAEDNQSFLNMLHEQTEGLSLQSNQKPVNRILKFKKDKVDQLNTFGKIESTFQEVKKILEKPYREPKFNRTSQTQLRRDKSRDNSVHSITESRASASRRSYQSRIKARQALYNINKTLNQ